MRSPRRVLFITAALACVSAVAFPALANIVAGITSNDPPLQIVGWESLFVTTYTSSPGVPINFNWYYACVNPGCAGDYLFQWNTGSGDQFAITWVYPGTVNFKATVDYDIDPNTGTAPPSTTAFSGPYVVHAANTETLTAPIPPGASPAVSPPVQCDYDTPSIYTDFISKFSYYDGTDHGLGMDASTTCEEKLEYVQPFVKTIDWAAGSPATWTFSVNTLDDKKGTTLSSDPAALAAFDALAVGAVLTEHYQTNRLVFMDCCGQRQTFEGPRRHYFRKKAAPPPSDPTGRYWYMELATP